MKVEKTNVHRLTVERECGCKATREYSDPQYKTALAEATFVSCKKHAKTPDIADMMSMIMREDVDREAQTNAAPTYAPMRVPQAEPTTLDNTTGETVTSTPIVRRPGPARVAIAPSGSGVPAPQQGPRRDPTQVRTVNRDRSGLSRRAAVAGRAPVASVTVSNPAGARRPQTVQVGEVELSTPGMDIDIEGVAEDPRVTALAENALLPDLEDDPTQA